MQAGRDKLVEMNILIQNNNPNTCIFLISFCIILAYSHGTRCRSDQQDYRSNLSSLKYWEAAMTSAKVMRSLIIIFFLTILVWSVLCHARLLGITIDHKLTWAKHFTDLKNSFVTKLNLLKKMLFSKKKISPGLIFKSDSPFCVLRYHDLGKLQ